MAEPLVQQVTLDLSRAEADARKLADSIAKSVGVVRVQLEGADKAQDALDRVKKSSDDAAAGIAKTNQETKALASIDLSQLSATIAKATQNADALTDAANKAGFAVSNIAGKGDGGALTANLSQISDGIQRTATVSVDADGKVSLLRTGMKDLGQIGEATGASLQSGANSALSALVNQAGPASGILGNLVGTLAKMGPEGLAAASAIAEIGAAVGATVAASVQFQGLSQEITRLTGAVGPQLDQLQARLTNTLQGTGVQADQVAGIVGTLERNLHSLDSSAQLDFITERFTKLAQTFQGGATDALKFTEVIQQFGADTQQQSDFMDALTQATTKYSGSLQALLSDVAGNAGQFKTFGFDLPELASLSAQLQQVGSSLSEVSPGIKRFASDTVKAGGDVRTELTLVVQQIHDATDANQALEIATHAFGQRAAINLVNPIKDGRLSVADLTAALGDYHGALDRTAPGTVGLGTAVNQLKNSFLGVGGKNGLADSLTQTMHDLEPAAKAAGEGALVLAQALDVMASHAPQTLSFLGNLVGMIPLVGPGLDALGHAVAAAAGAGEGRSTTASSAAAAGPAPFSAPDQHAANDAAISKAAAEAAGNKQKIDAESQALRELAAIGAGSVGPTMEQLNRIFADTGKTTPELTQLQQKLNSALGEAALPTQALTEAQRLLFQAQADGKVTSQEYADISAKTGVDVLDLISINKGLESGLQGVKTQQNFTNEELRFASDLFVQTGSAASVAGAAMVQFGLNAQQAGQLAVLAANQANAGIQALAGLAPKFADATKSIVKDNKDSGAAAKSASQDQQAALQAQETALTRNADARKRAVDDQIRDLERQDHALHQLISSFDLLSKAERKKAEEEIGYAQTQANIRATVEQQRTVDAQNRAAELRAQAAAAAQAGDAAAAAQAGDAVAAKQLSDQADATLAKLSADRQRLEGEQKAFEQQAVAPRDRLAKDDANQAQKSSAEKQLEDNYQTKQNLEDLKRSIDDETRAATASIQDEKTALAAAVRDIGTAVRGSSEASSVDVATAFDGFRGMIDGQIAATEAAVRLKKQGLDDAVALILDPNSGLSGEQQRQFLTQLDALPPETQRALETEAETIRANFAELKTKAAEGGADIFNTDNQVARDRAKARGSEVSGSYKEGVVGGLDAWALADAATLGLDIDKLENNLLPGGEQGKKSGEAFSNANAKAINDGKPQISAAASSAASGTPTFFAAQGQAAGDSFAWNFANGIEGQLARGTQIGANFGRDIGSAMGGDTAGAYAQGERIADSFTSGIIDRLYASATKLNPVLAFVGGVIVAATKASLGIQSPSKIAMEIGEHYTDGLALGILNTAGKIDKAARQAVSPLSKAVGVQVNATVGAQRVGGPGGPMVAVLDRRDSDRLVKAITASGPRQTTARPYRPAGG